MGITDYLRIFRRYWWLTALLAIIGAVIGYLSWVTTWGIVDLTPKYESSSTLFVATQTGTTTAEAYQNNLFSQQRAVSYAALATSDQVAARAVDQLKAPISPDELRGKITAAPRPNTVMLNVSVQDASPTQAQAYAAAVSDQLVAVVAELETSRLGGTPASAAVVVDDANYPYETSGLGLGLRIALGAAGGLVVGLLVALLIGVSDRRLRGRDNIESATGSLLIGALPKDPVRPKVAVVELDGDSLYAERVRELRTNLRFTALPDGSGPPRRIAVTSPVAGDGRTTMAIDLAAALAESGRSVILVDGDLRHSTIIDRLSLDDSDRAMAAQHGLSTVLLGEDHLGDAVVTAVEAGSHTIAVLPAGPQAPRPGELWATDRAAEIFDQLGESYDYVVVDTPPLDTYTDGAIVGALTDGSILLARIAGTGVASLRRAVAALHSAHVTLLGTVATFDPVGRLSLRRHRRQRSRIAAADPIADETDDDGLPEASTASVDINGSGTDRRAAPAGTTGRAQPPAHSRVRVSEENH